MSDHKLVIAIQLDTPPYVMDHGRAGIGIEIIREALRASGYTFAVRQMPLGQLADAIVTKNVDAAASVIKREDGSYYSDNYIFLRNLSISMKSSGITIDRISDLKGKSILAWEDAYEDLGFEFQALFSPWVKEPYREKYKEIPDQREQVEMFWRREADVILIDEFVMRWFTKELSGQVDTSGTLVYHRIFPGETHFRVGFRSERVRYDFDAGLNRIRSSGLYEKIYDDYLK